MRRYFIYPISIVLTVLSLSSCVTESMLQQAEILLLQGSEVTELKVEDNKLYILGVLNGKTFGQMREAFDEHPEVDTLVFTAMPGSIDDGTTIAMGQWLRKKQIRTHLLSNAAIASGAVDLYLSGVERTAEEGAQIGVHSWSDGSREAKELPRDHKDHRPYLAYSDSMLGSTDYYWFTIEAAPSDDIHWMTPSEVERYGLLTAPWSPPSRDKTPFGDAFEEMRQEVLGD